MLLDLFWRLSFLCILRGDYSVTFWSELAPLDMQTILLNMQFNVKPDNSGRWSFCNHNEKKDNLYTLACVSFVSNLPSSGHLFFK